MKITLKKSLRSVSLMSKMALLTHKRYPLAVPHFKQETKEEQAARMLASMCGDVRNRLFHDYGSHAELTSQLAVQKGAILDKPYNLVLLYDVIDHMPEPVAFLQKAREDMVLGGTALLRCHPWSARDACHLARSCNKAFLHVVLSEAERDSLALYGQLSHPETLQGPEIYRQWFMAANFAVVYEEVIALPVEDFFTSDLFCELFTAKLSPVQYVDYILEAV